MKKIIVFVLLITILFYAKNNSNNFSLLNYFSGEYCAYSTQESENCISLGFCNISQTKDDASYVIGESIKIKNLEINTALKTLKAKVVKTEHLNNITIIYAYTPLINTSLIEKNKQINLQIAINNEYTTIGWPLILGSF